MWERRWRWPYFWLSSVSAILTGGFTLALRELTAPGRKAGISAHQQLSVGGPSISWEACTRRTQFRQLAPPWRCWIQGWSIFLLQHPVTSVKWPRAIAFNVWPEDTQNTWRKNVVTVIKIEMLFVFFTMLVFAPKSWMKLYHFPRTVVTNLTFSTTITAHWLLFTSVVAFPQWSPV